MKINFGKEDIVNVKDFFFKEIEKSGEARDSTPPSQNGALVVPSVYLLPSEFVEIEEHLAIPGMMFQIHSFENAVYFVLEIDYPVFIKGYDPLKSNLISLFRVDRKDILDYENEGIQKYTAIKPKQSYQFLYNLGPAGVAGGLISGIIQRGAVKLGAKIEDDVQTNEGNIYKLKCKINGQTADIRVACENSYKNYFEDFLKKQWTTEIPQEQKEEASSGCFIATACYGDYDHPKVIVLRQFRDNVLSKTKLGKCFISVYYKYSPALAKKIENIELLKTIVRFFVISPLAKLTSKFKK